MLDFEIGGAFPDFLFVCFSFSRWLGPRDTWVSRPNSRWLLPYACACKPCEHDDLQNKQHADFCFDVWLHLNIRKVTFKYWVARSKPSPIKPLCWKPQSFSIQVPHQRGVLSFLLVVMVSEPSLFAFYIQGRWVPSWRFLSNTDFNIQYGCLENRLHGDSCNKTSFSFVPVSYLIKQ